MDDQPVIYVEPRQDKKRFTYSTLADLGAWIQCVGPEWTNWTCRVFDCVDCMVAVFTARGSSDGGLLSRRRPGCCEFHYDIVLMIPDEHLKGMSVMEKKAKSEGESWLSLQRSSKSRECWSG